MNGTLCCRCRYAKHDLKKRNLDTWNVIVLQSCGEPDMLPDIQVLQVQVQDLPINLRDDQELLECGGN